MFHLMSDGAYCEALEASAKWIMMATQSSHHHHHHHNISPPSVASTEDFENCDNESIDDDEPSSLSSVSMGSDDVTTCDAVNEAEGDEDIDSEIEFLKEKQRLLKRAISAMKSEEVYDAMTAPMTIKQESLPTADEKSLWAEAKELLDIMMPTKKESESTSQGQNSSSSDDDDEDPSVEREPKRPRIDVDMVTWVASNDAQESDPYPSERRIPYAMPFPTTGTWMTKALTAQNYDDPIKTQNCSNNNEKWEIINDPNLGDLVLPPTQVNFPKEIQLKDALAFSSTPQLITLSTPPFTIVHSNRAFGFLSGESNMIGKEVENILHVDDSAMIQGGGQSSYQEVLNGRMLLPQNNNSCHISVCPIIDRLSNPRGGISHLLLQVKLGHKAITEDRNVNTNISTKNDVDGEKEENFGDIEPSNDEYGESDIFLTTVG